MPNRILRDWTDSYHIEKLSAEEERLFTRLLMKADDYGRFHGDPRLIRSACFPLLASVTDADVSRWVQECLDSQCLVGYEVNGRRYLAVVEFKQRLRNEASKFPSPEGFGSEWLPTYDSLLTVNGPSFVCPSTARASNTHTTPQASPTSPPSPTPNRDVISKRLHGIPSCVEEVIAYGKTVLPPDGPITESRCRAFWRHYEGQARTSPGGDIFWVTSSDAVVTNWRVRLPSFKEDFNNGKPHSKPDHRAERAAKEFQEPDLKPKIVKAY